MSDVTVALSTMYYTVNGINAKNLTAETFILSYGIYRHIAHPGYHKIYFTLKLMDFLQTYLQVRLVEKTV